MPDVFRITEHTLAASHIRGYPRSTSTSQEDVLQLAIKQYTPLSNPNPKPGDVTIIAAHANAFPKELYEPLWDDLLAISSIHGFGIRGIWIADTVNQGYSSILNETKLGDDPSWLDHGRDLLHLINTFRAEMPRPLIGIGHSMGGCQLVNLALMHPRLLETLILIDPVIQPVSSFKGGYLPAASSTQRRDRWPSREEAAKNMMKSRFYQAWDRRVFDLWIRFGLRDIPTALYIDSVAERQSSDAASTGGLPLPTSSISLDPVSTTPSPRPAQVPEQVTLTTTKHQEVATFLRPNLPSSSTINAEPSSADYSLSNPSALNRRTHPDLTPLATRQAPFYRPEMVSVFYQLPHLRPSTLYLFGETSFITKEPGEVARKVESTGTGAGGSGGAKEGRVEHVIVQGAGHLVPMEKVGESARLVAGWVGKEMARWEREEELNERDWEGRTGTQRSMLTERYVDELLKVTGQHKASKAKGGGASKL